MSIEKVEILNLETGERGRIRRDWLENEAIVRPGLLIEVDPEQKPYVSELYRSKVDGADVEDDDENADEETRGDQHLDDALDFGDTPDEEEND